LSHYSKVFPVRFSNNAYQLSQCQYMYVHRKKCLGEKTVIFEKHNPSLLKPNMYLSKPLKHSCFSIFRRVMYVCNLQFESDTCSVFVLHQFFSSINAAIQLLESSFRIYSHFAFLASKLGICCYFHDFREFPD
jgi:hypothetical protein